MDEIIYCSECKQKDAEIVRLTQRLAAIKILLHHVGPVCQYKLKELLPDVEGCTIEELGKTYEFK